MKFTVALIAAVLISGCSLTPTQKKVAGFAAGVLVVGAIAAHELDNGGHDAASGSRHVSTPGVACAPACAQ